MIKKTVFTALTVLKCLLVGILSLLLAAELYVTVAQGVFQRKNATVFGFRSAVVLTGSMSGTIEPDDLIVTKKASSYAVGDIVTYTTDGISVTHRITGETEKGFVTQGDANNAPDADPVTGEQIVGRVVLVIPRVGAVRRFLGSPLGLMCLIAVLVLVMFVPEFFRKRKKD